MQGRVLRGSPSLRLLNRLPRNALRYAWIQLDKRLQTLHGICRMMRHTVHVLHVLAQQLND